MQQHAELKHALALQILILWLDQNSISAAGARTLVGLRHATTLHTLELSLANNRNPPPPPPPFQGPSFPKSARNVSLDQWISDSGGKKDHLLKLFVLW